MSPIVERVWKAVFGTPYTTSRTASIEFGPPPAARYRAELDKYSDSMLLKHGPAILRALIERDAQQARQDQRHVTTVPVTR